MCFWPLIPFLAPSKRSDNRSSGRGFGARCHVTDPCPCLPRSASQSACWETWKRWGSKCHTSSPQQSTNTLIFVIQVGKSGSGVHLNGLKRRTWQKEAGQQDFSLEREAHQQKLKHETTCEGAFGMPRLIFLSNLVSKNSERNVCVLRA